MHHVCTEFNQSFPLKELKRPGGEQMSKLIRIGCGRKMRDKTSPNTR